MFSQATEMALLLFFHLAALWPSHIPFATSLLKKIRTFYVAATVLSCSIATAALVTFWHQRSASNALHANFGYFNFYANAMLALAPPLSVMPAVVLVLMPPKIQTRGSTDKLQLWDRDKGTNTTCFWARLCVIILYVFCIVVMWVIWSLGVKDQQSPTRIVFGGRLNLRVSSFIYRHTGTYVLLVCILMSALPAIASAAFATLLVWHGIRKTGATQRSQSLTFLRDRCRDMCFLFGFVQLVMFAYIRGQAVYQAGGATAETDWGFGQILVIFTWLPLLLLICSGIISTIVDRVLLRLW
jgi:hypothetical protein